MHGKHTSSRHGQLAVTLPHTSIRAACRLMRVAAFNGNVGEVRQLCERFHAATYVNETERVRDDAQERRAQGLTCMKLSSWPVSTHARANSQSGCRHAPWKH